MMKIGAILLWNLHLGHPWFAGNIPFIKRIVRDVLHSGQVRDTFPVYFVSIVIILYHNTFC